MFNKDAQVSEKATKTDGCHSCVISYQTLFCLEAILESSTHKSDKIPTFKLLIKKDTLNNVNFDAGIPRQCGVKGKDISYPKGFVLDAEENREVEFKSLTSAHSSLLPWKIMDKAKKFICACLNADRKGIIYFGVGDCQEQNSRFKRGEILGLQVEDIIDDITKAFQFVLDDHIKSDDGPLKKGGDQNCVNIEFIPVMSEGNRTNLYVVEIEVSRDWKLCKDNVYYSKCWTEKRGVKIEKDLCTKKLSDFYKVLKDEFDDVAIRTNGASSSVKQHEVNRQVKEPLTAKYKEWKRETKHGKCVYFLLVSSYVGWWLYRCCTLRSKMEEQKSLPLAELNHVFGKHFLAQMFGK